MPQMNMQQMMKQARKMQEKLAATEEKLAQTEVTAFCWRRHGEGGCHG